MTCTHTCRQGRECACAADDSDAELDGVVRTVVIAGLGFLAISIWIGAMWVLA
jgi:hypothetical protein